MKKTTLQFLSILTLVLILIVSCKKGGYGGRHGPSSGATGPAGPSLTGNMNGFVTLYDITGAKILINLKNDSVILTNNSTNAILRTVTDSTGKYLFSNITTGTYNIQISRNGYGTLLLEDVQFAGGGNEYKNGALSMVPISTVTSLASVDTTINTVNNVKVRGVIPVSSGTSAVIIYISIPGTSSASSNVTNFSSYYVVNIAAGNTGFYLDIPTANLYDLGFSSGNTVYFSAYMIGASTSSSSYQDLGTGKSIFTAISAASVTSSVAVQ
jgi:hypothetical protein